MNRKAFGFTIMEATVAMALLTIGMLTLAGVFSQIVKSNAFNKRKQTASFLAVRKLAQLRAWPLMDISESKGVFEKPFGQYSWQVHIVYSSDNEKVCNVRLDVSYGPETTVGMWTQIGIDHAE